MGWNWKVTLYDSIYLQTRMINWKKAKIAQVNLQPTLWAVKTKTNDMLLKRCPNNDTPSGGHLCDASYAVCCFSVYETPAV
jgi:hypothetical protein